MILKRKVKKVKKKKLLFFFPRQISPIKHLKIFFQNKIINYTQTIWIHNNLIVKKINLFFLKNKQIYQYKKNIKLLKNKKNVSRIKNKLNNYPNINLKINY